MAGLPPKPVDSPLKDIDDRRYAPEDRDRRSARPMASRYQPRAQQGHDTYIASGYNRRDDDTRRGDYDDRDRDRRSWEPSRDRDRLRDRGHPPRRWEYESDYERDRRGYDRDRHFDRRRDDPPYNRFRDSDRRDSRLSPRRSDSYRRSSRTPPPRRRISVSPRRGRDYSRTRSPPRSPQPKRLKLGNHSIGASPRSRSRSREPALPQDDPKNAAKPKSPGRSLARIPGGDADAQTKQTPNIIQPKPEPTLADASTVLEPLGSNNTEPSGAVLDEKPTQPHVAETAESSAMPIDPPNLGLTTVGAPSPNPASMSTANAPSTTNDPQSSALAGAAGPSSDIQMRDVSHSPPRHPRYRGDAPRGAPLRRLSRSPPRGPRNQNQFRNPQAPPLSTHHPTAPRGRRAFPPTPTAPSTASSAPTVSAATPLTPDQELEQTHEAEPELVFEAKVPLPNIPQWQRPPLTGLQGEIVRLRAHQARFAVEHPSMERASWRALYELDLSTIDLRAAEARRKVADAQMEKARFGLLGIDAVQSDTPIV